jgi:hypothetical protein
MSEEPKLSRLDAEARLIALRQSCASARSVVEEIERIASYYAQPEVEAALVGRVELVLRNIGDLKEWCETWEETLRECRRI